MRSIRARDAVESFYAYFGPIAATSFRALIAGLLLRRQPGAVSTADMVFYMS